MGWFDNQKSPKLKSSKKSNSQTPSGLWKKCPSCSEIIYHAKLEENNQVCPYCDHHFRISAQMRLDLIIDEGTFKSYGDSVGSNDPLKFHDRKAYSDRLEKAKDDTGKTDGTLCGLAKVNGLDVAIAVMDFKFIGGSMGVATGEKVAFAMDLAFEHKVPCIVVCASGGARMQEGILSLMQMAKVSASRDRLKREGIAFLSILTDPTTGGVAASFGMQGDLNIAEPKSLIGFAGPRVIEQTIRQSLPEGFQRAEFLKEHGFVDRVIARSELKDEIAFFVEMFGK